MELEKVSALTEGKKKQDGDSAQRYQKVQWE